MEFIIALCVFAFVPNLLTAVLLIVLFMRWREYSKQ